MHLCLCNDVALPNLNKDVEVTCASANETRVTHPRCPAQSSRGKSPTPEICSARSSRCARSLETHRAPGPVAAWTSSTAAGSSSAELPGWSPAFAATISRRPPATSCITAKRDAIPQKYYTDPPTCQAIYSNATPRSAPLMSAYAKFNCTRAS